MTENRTLPAASASPSVDAATFRRAMRLHPAGLTIVTLDGADGPVGFTASSPSGLSAEPALITFNVGLSSSSLGAVLEARTAVIHLLGAGDEPLALRFSGPSSLRFADRSLWTRAATGEPHLLSSRARLRVALDRLIPAGDHVLVIARLLDTWFDEAPAEPLVVSEGGFRTVA
jgi:flavin reductase (DIM6/NTAB) family NADH-FMN oxidoreductase RutF